MLSNLEIKQFLEQDVTLLPQSGLEALELMANENIKRTSIYNKIRLPLLIMERDHAFIAPFQISVSNFITSKKLSAEVVLFLNKDFNYNFSEKIVLIENADPGFDLLFSKNIGGLITKYGGANSHMAIRCAEFGIPAAIGCGEQLFEKLSKYKNVY